MIQSCARVSARLLDIFGNAWSFFLEIIHKLAKTHNDAKYLYIYMYIYCFRSPCSRVYLSRSPPASVLLGQVQQAPTTRRLVVGKRATGADDCPRTPLRHLSRGHQATGAARPSATRTATPQEGPRRLTLVYGLNSRPCDGAVAAGGAQEPQGKFQQKCPHGSRGAALLKGPSRQATDD